MDDMAGLAVPDSACVKAIAALQARDNSSEGGDGFGGGGGSDGVGAVLDESLSHVTSQPLFTNADGSTDCVAVRCVQFRNSAVPPTVVFKGRELAVKWIGNYSLSLSLSLFSLSLLLCVCHQLSSLWNG